MDFHVADVVPVTFKVFNLLHGVIIIDTDAHIVTGGDEPLFTRDEFGTTDGELGHLECFDVGSGFVVPDGDVAGVEGREGP